jgi:hypothetical protein
MLKRRRGSGLIIGHFPMQFQRKEKNLGPGKANDHGRGQIRWIPLRGIEAMR